MYLNALENVSITFLRLDADIFPYPSLHNRTRSIRVDGELKWI